MNNIHINLSMLRVLDALAEEGNFTRAAERVCMTQSGVSHALRGLEEAAGAPLVVRERAGVVFTEAGRRALSEARAALRCVDRIRSLNAAVAVTGVVRIGLVPSAAARLAPPALRGLRRDYPGIEPRLLEGTDQEVTAWVDEGLADLGIAGERGNCASEPLTRDDLLLVMPESHPLAASGPVAVTALDGVPFVMSGSGCEPMLSRLFAEAGVAVDVRLRVRDMGTLLAMVRTGLGVSIVPELALPAGRHEGLAARPLLPAAHRQLYVLRGRNASAAAIEQALAAFKRVGGGTR